MSFERVLPLALAFCGFCIIDRGFLLEIILSKGTTIRDTTSVSGRLSQLGKSSKENYENFRIAQMIYVVGLYLLSSFLLFADLINFFTYVFLLIGAPILVIVISERDLNRRCTQRRVEIESEFPAIVEMLTLAVGAGESPASALRRISSRAGGHLSKEFSSVVSQLEDGVPFTTALDLMSRQLNSDSIRRFVDSIIISISRGTSLVETLSHGANESRNQEKVRLLTAAGKSEVSMMIPVVFLILPISILFALFPSLTNLNLFTN